jgi:peptidyl-prolyl cis-trans isomerase SurA
MITMTLFGNKKLHLILIAFLSVIFIFNQVNSLENKILIKIDNEIITSLDVLDEMNYLKALNRDIRNLDEKQIYEIAKKTLVRDKIKSIELLRYVDKIEVNKEYINRIIKITQKKIGTDSENEFKNYIKKFNLDLAKIESKISIEALWNELIVSKYSKKIKIDENNIKNKILAKDNEFIKKYLLSEILFTVDKNIEVEKKFNEIKDSIEKVGFENTSLMYSISDSSKEGGKLGWVNENSLGKKIKLNLENLKIGDLTNPIITPGGLLILKITDIELTKKKLDLKKEMKKMIILEKNNQLNQYSSIYFKKISRNTEINEL